MDKSYRTKLEERNKLLAKIQTSVDALLNDEQRLTIVCYPVPSPVFLLIP